MTEWQCETCEQRSCSLTLEEGQIPTFCPVTSWPEHPRGGGARWQQAAPVEFDFCEHEDECRAECELTGTRTRKGERIEPRDLALEFYGCRGCRKECLLAIRTEDPAPEFCMYDGTKEFRPDRGGPDWYHCDEAGNDLTDEDVDADYRAYVAAKDD